MKKPKKTFYAVFKHVEDGTVVEFDNLKDYRHWRDNENLYDWYLVKLTSKGNTKDDL